MCGICGIVYFDHSPVQEKPVRDMMRLQKHRGPEMMKVYSEKKWRGEGSFPGMVKRDWRLFRHCLSDRPDLLMGTSAEIDHVGTLLGIPSVNVVVYRNETMSLIC